MRILWIATKSPLPPTDGGRLVTVHTLTALAELGINVDVVAPTPSATSTHQAIARSTAPWRTHLVPVQKRSAVRDLLHSWLGRRPFTIQRHRFPAVTDAVEQLIAQHRFDVVHVEQLQAFAHARPALARGLPVILRAQNVESDLWQGAARRRQAFTSWIGREVRRLERHEADAVRRSTFTIALTAPDRGRLRELAEEEAEVEMVPPPFPASLPASESALAGDPALVLLGRTDWAPNRDACDWFLEEAWPDLHAALPDARLHLFGAVHALPRAGRALVFHDFAEESRAAFAPGAILIVPLRFGSGVRMKILEAWARGVPVVATPEAAAGLEAEDGTELLIARGAAEFTPAIRRLMDDSELRERLIASGRRALAQRHDPANVARRLRELYGAAARRLS